MRDQEEIPVQKVLNAQYFCLFLSIFSFKNLW